MTIQRFLIVLMKWLAAFALAAGIVMLIRLFCIESYRISTDSMEEALHKGDYILVNKIPGKNKPVRGKVVLFTSPLSRDSADAPLFISRCIGMPGDTIRVSMDGYTINLVAPRVGAWIETLYDLHRPKPVTRPTPSGCVY